MRFSKLLVRLTSPASFHGVNSQLPWCASFYGVQWACNNLPVARLLHGPTFRLPSHRPPVSTYSNNYVCSNVPRCGHGRSEEHINRRCGTTMDNAILLKRQGSQRLDVAEEPKELMICLIALNYGEQFGESSLRGNCVELKYWFLTKLLTEDLPRLFVRPNKIVLNFQEGKAMGPVSKDFKNGVIQEGNKDFAGELSVTLVDARKLNYVPYGKTDPYVVLVLGDQVIRSKKNSQTTVIGPPGSPIWNQDFQLLVVDPQKQRLNVQVRDSFGLTTFTVGRGEVYCLGGVVASGLGASGIVPDFGVEIDVEAAASVVIGTVRDAPPLKY
eukprot:Gb_01148 [translate_table: standard]